MEAIKGLGSITDAEKTLIAAALEELAASIQKVCWICSVIDHSPNCVLIIGRFIHRGPQALEKSVTWYNIITVVRGVCLFQ